VQNAEQSGRSAEGLCTRQSGALAEGSHPCSPPVQSPGNLTPYPHLLQRLTCQTRVSLHSGKRPVCRVLRYPLTPMGSLSESPSRLSPLTLVGTLRAGPPSTNQIKCLGPRKSRVLVADGPRRLDGGIGWDSRPFWGFNSFVLRGMCLHSMLFVGVFASRATPACADPAPVVCSVISVCRSSFFLFFFPSIPCRLSSTVLIRHCSAGEQFQEWRGLGCPS
jgi:hypothetical protein